MAETTARVPVSEQIRTMGWNFWIANLMETFERLAFFGVRAVLPLYMVSDKAGGLGLSYNEKGFIYFAWALVQCLLPMISGGYTDAYGYRKSLVVAFVINISGYCLMANASGFATMLTASLLVGAGTAIFKPPVQGTVAKSLNEGNSGLGFGIFYEVVNIGGFIAPMAFSMLRGNDEHPTWSYAFYGAAIVTAFNFLPAFFLYRDPPVDLVARGKKPVKVFVDSIGGLFKDRQVLMFLLIISGFWLMFMQLWDLLPNFIDEWVDARDFGALLTSMMGTGASGLLAADGAAKPEILINIDSFAIILLVLPISWFFGRYKMMVALGLGMAISLVGFVGSGLFQGGILVGAMIFVFALGEMLCSPKFSEYIGMTAPPDKKALYMGYSNIPYAIGWAFGNALSGPLYERFASKANLARQYLTSHYGVAADSLKELKLAPLMKMLSEKMNGASDYEINKVLWDAYHPWSVWFMLGAVGLASLIGMAWFYRSSQSKAAAPAAEAAKAA